MELKFKCPNCADKRLESVETDVTVETIIVKIDEEGDFEYGKQNYCNGGYVDRFQCANCGYVLKNENKVSLTLNLSVVEWLKKNCSQD